MNRRNFLAMFGAVPFIQNFFKRKEQPQKQPIKCLGAAWEKIYGRNILSTERIPPLNTEVFWLDLDLKPHIMLLRETEEIPYFDVVKHKYLEINVEGVGRYSIRGKQTQPQLYVFVK